MVGWAALTHRDNLLDASFSQVGFGVAQSANYTATGSSPMTIVVAFYAKPASGEPVIASVKGDSSSTNVSMAQLAVARLPIVGLATDLAIGAALMAILIWAGRHIRAFRRALISGERFASPTPSSMSG